MVIRPEPLTASAFHAFGEVIQMEGHQPHEINSGNTKKYADLARLVASDGARLALHLYRSTPVESPFTIRSMERHPLGSQAFVPLHDRPFPVVVALPGPAPGAADIRVFLSNGLQGVNLHPGTWHHYQLSLGQESDYLVIDRVGGEENFEEVILSEPVLLQI